MPRTTPDVQEKLASSDKEERKIGHIEEGYERRGVPAAEAKRRAFATANKQSGGSKRRGGMKKAENAGTKGRTRNPKSAGRGTVSGRGKSGGKGKPSPGRGRRKTK